MNIPLKVAIVESQKTQVQLAKRMGIDPTRLSEFVQGKRQPNAEKRARLAKLLKRDEATLFPGLV